MDYYKILGLDNKATHEDIRKNYRKLSLKHHPDRGGDADEFKKINEAFQTLGDKQKRQQYDMQKNNPFMRMGGRDPGIDNIMKMFFGGIPGMPGMPGMPNAFPHNVNFTGGNMPNIQIFRNGQPVNINAMRKPAPITKTVTISIEDAYSGITHPIHIERWVMYGNERRVEKEKIYVNILPGIDDGERMLLKDKGNIINDEIKGDIQLFIKIKNDSKFVRDGLDLIYKKNITLKEALTGFEFDIHHINGKVYSINNDAGNIIQPNYVRDIQNLGMHRGNKCGKLIISFDLKFPDKLTTHQIEGLKELL